MTYFDDLAFVETGVEVESDRAFDLVRPPLGLLLAGSGALRVSIDGQRPVGVDAPFALWHHPEHRYEYGPVDGGTWTRYWAFFEGPRAVRVVEQGLMPLAEAGYIGLRHGEAFEEAFRDLVRLAESDSVRSHPKAVLALEKLVVMLWDEWYGEETGHRRVQIEQVGREVGSDPYEAFDFHAAAERLHISYRQFCRLFRRHMGHSPHEYLLLCRMRKAAGELLAEGSSVKAVAMRAGYDDPAQFSRLFKRKIGMSPRKFRDYGLRL